MENCSPRPEDFPDVALVGDDIISLKLTPRKDFPDELSIKLKNGKFVVLSVIITGKQVFPKEG